TLVACYFEIYKIKTDFQLFATFIYAPAKINPTCRTLMKSTSKL
ncbi:MAG: hypothetical protein ACI9DK_002883, partial [Vicingaceae bacterium]